MLPQIYKWNRQRECASFNSVQLQRRQYSRNRSKIWGVMLLVLMVIASSSVRRFITQSRSFWIMASMSSLCYLPGRPLLVRRLLKVFSKLSFVQMSCKIPVEISLALIDWSSASDYQNQRTLYCAIPVLVSLRYSIAFSSSYMSCETGPRFSNWRYGNVVELLFT